MKSLGLWVGIGAAVSIIGIVGVWFIFFRSTTPTTNPQPAGSFNTGNTQNVGVGTTNTDSENTTSTLPSTSSASQKVFKIANGPVTSATFIQTLRPTTTLARYVLQENGHVQDLALDTPGTIARATSNTTIPGSTVGTWAENGNTVVLQYFDSKIKTVSLNFTQSTSSPVSTRLRFLPDNITSYAISPDGKQITYLISAQAGVDGYVARVDGTESKKLFSFVLSQVIISWPSQNTLLLSTKSAADIAGMIFSVNAKTGGITPLIYAPGVSATADRAFTRVLYQTRGGDTAHSSYVRNITNGTTHTLSLDPIPEKCVWSKLATSTVYCATPVVSTPSNYLELWHQGAQSVADSIVYFDVNQGNKTIVIAVPGSSDGGVISDISEIALSPDEKYLLFIKKGDRSLWGVRLR